MNHLNYFNPYHSKESYHEDQLTRAYLSLLRHSFHAFASFFSYCAKTQKVREGEISISLINHLESGWVVETQRSNPQINTDWLLSVLITDLELPAQNEAMEISSRNAHYDGLITFGTALTIIIENKPRSYNVWFDQLKPSKENLNEETTIFSNPVQLEWKEIIRQLNHLSELNSISGSEGIMIADFLEYIDSEFPVLNPFDLFHLCKGNKELINRRIKNLLKSIVKSEDVIEYHRGWGHYIKTPYHQIQQIGLIFDEVGSKWKLELSFYFGDSQRQAISFYDSAPDVSHLGQDWFTKAHFHVSFMTSNLVWIESENKEEYLTYWIEHIKDIYQRNRKDVPQFLEQLSNSGIIDLTSTSRERLKAKFYDTQMQKLNICPGYGLIYTFESEIVESMDKEGKFAEYLTQKIREALKVVHLTGNEILR